VSVFYLVIGLVAAQRLAELAYAARNTRRLRARGAIEVGARHYPALVLLHAAWLAAMAIAIPPETAPNPPLLALFVVLQGARVWVIASLGGRWTTRIIVPVDAAPTRRGPYRFLRHPNYWIVCAEIAVLPLTFGAWRLALLFSALDAPLLWHRIRVENAALGYS